MLALSSGRRRRRPCRHAVKFLRPYAAQRLPFATDIAVDARAVWMTVGLSVATAVLIGMLPAMSARRENLVTRLRGGAGGASDAGGIAQRRVRDTLVAIQFALAITVLIGTGLLVRSVVRVASVPLGFDPNGVVSFAIRPPRGKYDQPAQAAALYQRILTAVNAVPSVELSAAAGGALLPTKVETDEHRGAESAVEARYHPISTDFFRPATHSNRRRAWFHRRGHAVTSRTRPLGYCTRQTNAPCGPLLTSPATVSMSRARSAVERGGHQHEAHAVGQQSGGRVASASGAEIGDCAVETGPAGRRRRPSPRRRAPAVGPQQCVGEPVAGARPEHQGARLVGLGPFGGDGRRQQHGVAIRT